MDMPLPGTPTDRGFLVVVGDEQYEVVTEMRCHMHVLDELGLTAVVGADNAELAARYTTAGFTVRSTGGTHHTLTRTPNPIQSRRRPQPAPTAATAAPRRSRAALPASSRWWRSTVISSPKETRPQ